MAKGDSTKPAVQAVNEPNPKFRLVVIDLTFAAADTYKTGGFTILPSEVGMTAILGVLAIGSKGYECAWAAATNNLLLYQQSAATSALTQIPDNTDISAVSPIRLLVIGVNV